VFLSLTHIRTHTHTVCDVHPLCSNSPCVINPCNYIVVFFPKALIKLCNVLYLPTLRKRLRQEKSRQVCDWMRMFKWTCDGERGNILACHEWAHPYICPSVCICENLWITVRAKRRYSCQWMESWLSHEHEQE